MNHIFESKLIIPAGVPEPDAFDDSNGRIPLRDFVVTRRRDGTTASVFGDLVWDFTAYTADGKTKRLFYSYWGKGPVTQSRNARAVEIRAIAFLLIWRRHGASLSVGTVSNYTTVLCACAQYADDNNMSVADMFSSQDFLLDFVFTRASGWMAQTLGGMLSVLARLSIDELGFRIVGSKCITKIKQHARQAQPLSRQHAPIPTRIYSQLLCGLQDELTSWLAVADEMLSLFNQCGRDPRLGRSRVRHSKIARANGLADERVKDFEELASPACIAYLITKGKQLSVGSVSAVVGEAQHLTKLLVQAYTGMREDEASSIPYICVEETVVDGKVHYYVKGRTTKLHHGLVKRAQWVTNAEAVSAIKAAQAIADSIYSVFDVFPAMSPENFANFPLYVTVRYMRLAGVPLTPEDDHFVTGDMQSRELPKSCIAPIGEEDLRELEHIDPHRAWRSEPDFHIGEPWPFKTHQLRRSLALYAQRSGLVSLPSLRRQLQHLTEEMSRYYANGSAFARNFIGDDKEHFGLEWQRTEPESAAISYILNVLLTEDTLFGGHATWVEHRLKQSGGTVLIDRAVTLKRFKKGEMAYRETILGGCTNTGPCDKVALQWLHVDCVRDNCKNLVCSIPKLERVIAAQTKMLTGLEHDSVEYRTEQEDLATLTLALAKAQGNTKESND